jgi:ferric-dicitrate binding protein FerR (iron transport regulator)
LKENPQYGNLVTESIAIMDDLVMQEKEISSEQSEEAFLRLQKSIIGKRNVGSYSKMKGWWLPAAAAIILLLVGLTFWSATNKKKALESAYGRVMNYSLPEGSEVTLNSNSKVLINKEWKNTDREIWLQGEAFFKVQKLPSKNKFVVHTQNMDIIVTGTQFNVISREEETSILLTEGSVTILTKDGMKVNMKPGEFVKIENNKPAKKTIDQQSVLAWKQLKISFENTSMNQVAKIISTHYGVKVQLSDEAIGQKKISGIMPNDSMDILINALEATGEFKISKTTNGILISEP